MPITLDPRPPGIRVLTEDEGIRLRRLFPGIPRTIANCITCAGTKSFTWLDRSGQPAEYECHCIDQRIMHQYFLHSGLDVLYQRYSWDDAKAVDPSVIDAILEYDSHMDAFIRTGRGLILRGAMTGTGKTMVAALLFKRMLARGIDGHFIQFNDLLEANSDGWGKSEKAEEQRAWFIRRVRNAGVLVIDDIGREFAAGKSMELIEATLDRVIRARHDGCRPTIITTNKTDDWFAKQYRGNIMSLLSGVCSVIDVKGADFRAQHKQRSEFEAQTGLIRPIVVE